MEFSRSLENNIELIIEIISSCETVDQLENSKEMIEFFCNNNNQNDKIPFAKQFLMGNLTMKAKTLEV
jgi:hypothetical protein